jgi:hypothetical protein
MNKGLWAKDIKIISNEGTLWAKLRIKNDTKSNEKYIDVLIGKKDAPYHMHIGINLDQSLKFQRFRGVVRSLTREVESMKRGLLENSTLLVDPTISPAKAFVFKINMDGNTGEVSIKEFGLESNSC